MAFIAVPNAAKVVVQYVSGVHIWTNTLWFSKVLFTDEDLSILAQSVDNGWGASIRVPMAVTASYAMTTAYDMRTSFGSVVSANTNAGVGSDSTHDMISLGSTVVLTLHTANRGRAGRGRLYVSGLSEAMWDDAGFTTAAKGFVESAWADMRSYITGSGWAPVVTSHFLDGAPRTPPVTQPVTSVSIRSSMAGSQRRRNHRG